MNKLWRHEKKLMKILENNETSKKTLKNRKNRQYWKLKLTIKIYNIFFIWDWGTTLNIISFNNSYINNYAAKKQ